MESKREVKEKRSYTYCPYYSPRKERIFCCFDFARDVIIHLNIKKIFSNFLKANENSRGGYCCKVSIDEEKRIPIFR